mgnify:FL=1
MANTIIHPKPAHLAGDSAKFHSKLVGGTAKKMKKSMKKAMKGKKGKKPMRKTMKKTKGGNFIKGIQNVFGRKRSGLTAEDKIIINDKYFLELTKTQLNKTTIDTKIKEKKSRLAEIMENRLKNYKYVNTWVKGFVNHKCDNLRTSCGSKHEFFGSGQVRNFVEANWIKEYNKDLKNLKESIKYLYSVRKVLYSGRNNSSDDEIIQHANIINDDPNVSVDGIYEEYYEGIIDLLYDVCNEIDFRVDKKNGTIHMEEDIDFNDKYSQYKYKLTGKKENQCKDIKLEEN